MIREFLLKYANVTKLIKWKRLYKRLLQKINRLKPSKLHTENSTKRVSVSSNATYLTYSTIITPLIYHNSMQDWAHKIYISRYY